MFESILKMTSPHTGTGSQGLPGGDSGMNTSGFQTQSVEVSNNSTRLFREIVARLSQQSCELQGW